MKKFRKLIRKIKQINGKDGKQCNDDEEEDHNSKKEEITDLTDNARITIVKSTNYQKERSQSTPKPDNNDFRSLNSIERGRYRSYSNPKMITLGK